MSDPDREPRSRREADRRQAGAIFLFAGIALVAVVLLDAGYGLPWAMPRTWYVNRMLWGALGLGVAAWGWYLQSARNAEPRWKPERPGKRFRRLIVYTRDECHLCDDAKAALAEYLDYLPDIEEVDIDSDPELKARFDTSVPVVELDGVVRFRGRVDEVLLRRLIDATPPDPRGEA